MGDEFELIREARRLQRLRDEVDAAFDAGFEEGRESNSAVIAMAVGAIAGALGTLGVVALVSWLF